MATLKEAASGHQYSQALLAGMSDGYCRELQREDPRGRQKSYVDFGGRWPRGDCVGGSAVPSLLPGQSVSHHMLARALHWCLWCHKTRQLVLTFTVAFFSPCGGKAGQPLQQWGLCQVVSWGRLQVSWWGVSSFEEQGKGRFGRKGAISNDERASKGG